MAFRYCFSLMISYSHKHVWGKNVREAQYVIDKARAKWWGAVSGPHPAASLSPHSAPEVSPGTTDANFRSIGPESVTARPAQGALIQNLHAWVGPSRHALPCTSVWIYTQLFSQLTAQPTVTSQHSVTGSPGMHFIGAPAEPGGSHSRCGLCLLSSAWTTDNSLEQG